jgi:GT2 family glycosyltransferase
MTSMQAGRSEKTAVIVATRGRPEVLQGLVEQLARQTLPPDHVFVVATSADDFAGLQAAERLTLHVGRPGLALQRNDGLALAGTAYSYIVFFDDDFVPSRFWLERMMALFRSRPDMSGLTGVVMADGTSTAGILPAEARAMVEQRDAEGVGEPILQEKVGYGGNTGCNMAFRCAAIQGLAFDERLPAYAWLEDADFRGQVARHGRFARAGTLWGVHLGHKQGRARGIPLGYSQIANSVYLAAKRTVPRSHLVQLALRNLLSNAARSLRPEPFVDRRGRLLGNIIALADLVRGRIAPERILGL